MFTRERSTSVPPASEELAACAGLMSSDAIKEAQLVALVDLAEHAPPGLLAAKDVRSQQIYELSQAVPADDVRKYLESRSEREKVGHTLASIAQEKEKIRRTLVSIAQAILACAEPPAYPKAQAYLKDTVEPAADFAHLTVEKLREAWAHKQRPANLLEIVRNNFTREEWWTTRMDGFDRSAAAIAKEIDLIWFLDTKEVHFPALEKKPDTSSLTDLDALHTAITERIEACWRVADLNSALMPDPNQFVTFLTFLNLPNDALADLPLSKLTDICCTLRLGGQEAAAVLLEKAVGMNEQEWTHSELAADELGRRLKIVLAKTGDPASLPISEIETLAAAREELATRVGISEFGRLGINDAEKLVLADARWIFREIADIGSRLDSLTLNAQRGIVQNWTAGLFARVQLFDEHYNAAFETVAPRQGHGQSAISADRNYNIKEAFNCLHDSFLRFTFAKELRKLYEAFIRRHPKLAIESEAHFEGIGLRDIRKATLEEDIASVKKVADQIKESVGDPLLREQALKGLRTEELVYSALEVTLRRLAADDLGDVLDQLYIELASAGFFEDAEKVATIRNMDAEAPERQVAIRNFATECLNFALERCREESWSPRSKLAAMAGRYLQASGGVTVWTEKLEQDVVFRENLGHLFEAIKPSAPSRFVGYRQIPPELMPVFDAYNAYTPTIDAAEV